MKLKFPEGVSHFLDLNGNQHTPDENGEVDTTGFESLIPDFLKAGFQKVEAVVASIEETVKELVTQDTDVEDETPVKVEGNENAGDQPSTSADATAADAESAPIAQESDTPLADSPAPAADENAGADVGNENPESEVGAADTTTSGDQ